MPEGDETEDPQDQNYEEEELDAIPPEEDEATPPEEESGEDYDAHVHGYPEETDATGETPPAEDTPPTLPETFSHPILFANRAGRRLTTSRTTNQDLFDALRAIRAVDDSGGQLRTEVHEGSKREFGRYATERLTEQDVYYQIRNTLYAHLVARTPLPPGYAEDNLAAIAQNLAKTLSPEISPLITDRYLATNPNLPARDRLQTAKDQARTAIEEYLADERTQEDVTQIIKRGLRGGRLLDPIKLSGEQADSFMNTLRGATTDAVWETIKHARVIDAQLEVSEEGIGLNRTVVSPYYIEEEAYETILTSDQAKRESLDKAAKIANEYGLETERVQHWVNDLWDRPGKAVVHIFARPLEPILYRSSWKPDWLKTLEKTTKPAATRKLIEKELWGLVRDLILTQPLIKDEDWDENGRYYSIFKRAKTKDGYKSYFTPLAAIVGAFKKSRLGQARRLESWAKGRASSSQLARDILENLVPRLRRKRKDDKDDKSSTLWWLAKTFVTTAWTLLKPGLRLLDQALGSPVGRLKGAAVNWWYRKEAGGGLLGNILKLTRGGRYFASALFGGWRGGLGYGAFAYIITGGNPLATGTVATFGWLGKAFSLLAANGEAIVWLRVSGIMPLVKLGNLLEAFSFPSLAEPGKTFTLIKFPMLVPLVSGLVTYALTGNPILAGLVATGGFFAQYQVSTVTTVIHHLVWPYLTETFPALKVLNVFKYWVWGFVGLVGGYLLGKYLGLPEWACLALGAGGMAALGLVGWGLKKITQLLPKVPIFRIVLRIIALRNIGQLFSWQSIKADLKLDTRVIINWLLRLEILQFFRGLIQGLLSIPWRPAFAAGIKEGIVVSVRGIITSIWRGLTGGISIRGILSAIVGAFTKIGTLISAGFAYLVAYFGGSILAGASIVLSALVIIAVLTFGTLSLYKETARWQGPGESRYLSLTKTVDKMEGAVAGDILTYKITYQTKDKRVENLVLEDRVLTAIEIRPDPYSPRSDVYCILNEDFGSEGYQLSPDSPAPDNVNPDYAITTPNVTNIFTVLTWNIGTLEPESGGEITYQVKVCDSYLPTQNSIDDRVTLTGRVEEAPGQFKEDRVVIDVYVNAVGRKKLAMIASQLSGCLETGYVPGGTYSYYDQACVAELNPKLNYWNCVKKYWSGKNGDLQCVLFVAGAMECAGVGVPYAGNAGTWFDGYTGKSGFQLIPNGTATPIPGDILVLKGGPSGFGHVAIIISANIDAEGNGTITYAHSNSDARTRTVNVENNEIEPRPNYEILGVIRVQQ